MPNIPASSKRSGQLTPAIIRFIQNIHRQLVVDEYPATIGPTTGPELETSPKTVIALPRYIGSGYTSENIPPMIA